MRLSTNFPSSASISRSSASLRGLVAILLALTLGMPAAATARKRVAVMKFTGPKAAKVEKSVVKALRKDGYGIVGAAAWKKAAKRARARGLSGAAMAKTAKKAGVSAIVFGKVRKKRRAFILVLSVYDRSGALLEKVEVPLKKGNVDRKASRALASDFLPVVARGEESGGDSGVAAAEPPRREEPPAEEPPPRREEPPAEEPAPRHLGLQSARAEQQPDEPRERGAGAVRKPAPSTRAAAQTVFAVGAGMSFWARRMSVSPSGTADSYKGRPVPGLRVDAEIYPLAAFTTGMATDFGVGFFLDQVWLSSQLEDPTTNTTVKLATTQSRWGADLRWRYRLGSSATSPTLQAAFSISSLKFTIGDRDQAPDLNIPDVSYLGFGPTVGLVVPIGSPSFRAGLSFSYLIVSGDDGNAPAGTTYDGTWGLDLGLHVDYLPFTWLLVRAQFGMTRYASTFVPTAPATTTGSSDTYVGGLLTASYVY